MSVSTSSLTRQQCERQADDFTCTSRNQWPITVALCVAVAVAVGVGAFLRRWQANDVQRRVSLNSFMKNPYRPQRFTSAVYAIAVVLLVAACHSSVQYNWDHLQVLTENTGLRCDQQFIATGIQVYARSLRRLGSRVQSVLTEAKRGVVLLDLDHEGGRLNVTGVATDITRRSRLSERLWTTFATLGVSSLFYGSAELTYMGYDNTLSRNHPTWWGDAPPTMEGAQQVRATVLQADVSSNGTILIDTNRVLNSDYRMTQRPWYQVGDVQQRGYGLVDQVDLFTNVSWTPRYQFVNGEWGYTLVRRAVSPGGATLGVWGADISAPELDAVLAHDTALLSPHAVSLLVDYNTGDMVAKSDANHTMLRVLHDAVATRTSHTGPVSFIHNGWYVTSTPIEVWVLTLAVPVQELYGVFEYQPVVDEMQTARKRAMVITCVLYGIGFILLVSWYIQRVLLSFAAPPVFRLLSFPVAIASVGFLLAGGLFALHHAGMNLVSHYDRLLVHCANSLKVTLTDRRARLWQDIFEEVWEYLHLPLSMNDRVVIDAAQGLLHVDNLDCDPQQRSMWRRDMWAALKAYPEVAFVFGGALYTYLGYERYELVPPTTYRYWRNETLPFPTSIVSQAGLYGVTLDTGVESFFPNGTTQDLQVFWSNYLMRGRPWYLAGQAGASRTVARAFLYPSSSSAKGISFSRLICPPPQPNWTRCHPDALQLPPLCPTGPGVIHSYDLTLNAISSFLHDIPVDTIDGFIYIVETDTQNLMGASDPTVPLVVNAHSIGADEADNTLIRTSFEHFRMHSYVPYGETTLRLDVNEYMYNGLNYTVQVREIVPSDIGDLDWLLVLVYPSLSAVPEDVDTRLSVTQYYDRVGFVSEVLLGVGLGFFFLAVLMANRLLIPKDKKAKQIWKKFDTNTQMLFDPTVVVRVPPWEDPAREPTMRVDAWLRQIPDNDTLGVPSDAIDRLLHDYDKHCRKPASMTARKEVGLTGCEHLAIFTYTYELGSGNVSWWLMADESLKFQFYSQLNALLREGKGEIFHGTAIDFWLPLLFPLVKGLRKVEQSPPRTFDTPSRRAWMAPLRRLLGLGVHPVVRDASLLYRGVNRAAEGIDTGKIVRWPAFSSCTTDWQVARNFAVLAAEELPHPTTLFVISCPGGGADIARFSRFPKESEVLLRPGTHFEVVNYSWDSVWYLLTGGVRYAHVRMVPEEELTLMRSSGCGRLPSGLSAVTRTDDDEEE